MKRWMNLLLLLWVAGHLSAQSWIAVVSPSEQQTPVTEIVASDAQQFVCRVQIPGMYDTEVVRNGVTYHALALQPYQTLQKVGEPALPVVTLQVGVPYGKGYACEITDASWQEIPVGKVYPFQKPLLETEEEGSFVMTSSVYGQEEYIPDVYAFGVENPV